MSKVLLYPRADNSVAIGYRGKKVWALLTGSGGGVRPDNIEREIAKHLIGDDKSAEAEFHQLIERFGSEIGSTQFCQARAGTPREIKVRAFIEGICYGGLTELEALTVIDGKDRPLECIDCHFIEDTDLPTDRYFRNAWEWSD